MTRIDPNEYTIRERAIHVTVTGAATRPPGRGKAWTVEVGDWRADGPTEVAATQTLASRLQTMLTQYRPPLVLTFRGYVAVLSIDLPDGEGISVVTTIAHPDGHTSSSQARVESWEQATDETRYRLADLSTDWHNDTSVYGGAAYLAKNKTRGERDLYEYAAWQRAAKSAMDSGKADWHGWACEHASEFAVVAPNAHRAHPATSGPFCLASDNARTPDGHRSTFVDADVTCPACIATYAPAGGDAQPLVSSWSTL